MEYSDEFVKRYKELGTGQQRLVEESLKLLISTEDPTAVSHHLTRGRIKCNWSHRVRSNLLIIFAISKQTKTFLTTGTHGQAYHLKR